MDRKFGLYVFVGLLIGGAFGMFIGAASGAFVWIAFGALIGLSVGWFAAAANLERRGEKQDK